jgi:hypothetical protein
MYAAMAQRLRIKLFMRGGALESQNSNGANFNLRCTICRSNRKEHNGIFSLEFFNTCVFQQMRQTGFLQALPLCKDWQTLEKSGSTVDLIFVFLEKPEIE